MVATNLTDSRERIYLAGRRWEDFGRPQLMRTLEQLRNQNKFCHYHNEPRHKTLECYTINDTIVDLNRRGRLWEYVACLKMN